MRGNRVLAVLAVAVVLGAGATYMVWRALNRPVPLQASETPSDVVEVVAAAVDLPLGTMLTEDKLKTVKVLASSLPPGHFTDRAQVLNRGVVIPMVANEFVLDSKLAPEGAGAGLPPVIPEGMRAVSVKVDEVIGVAGFVLPSTRVDVLVTVTPDDEQRTSITKQVLQNVQVLAAGESIEKDREGKPKTVTVITLLVSPEDAEKLTLAATQGQIQLALRNTLDEDSVATPGSNIKTLVTGPAPVSAPANPDRPRRARSVEPKPTTNVEMYRGVDKEVKSF
ncbi:MAG TPA: Flp pilus assembly protein CpaB [Gemmatimonadota bacterium]